MFSRRPGYGNFIRVGFGERWSERQDSAVKILGNLSPITLGLLFRNEVT
jgi:hypothetical protein